MKIEIEPKDFWIMQDTNGIHSLVCSARFAGRDQTMVLMREGETKNKKKISLITLYAQLAVLEEKLNAN